MFDNKQLSRIAATLFRQQNKLDMDLFVTNSVELPRTTDLKDALPYFEQILAEIKKAEDEKPLLIGQVLDVQKVIDAYQRLTDPSRVGQSYGHPFRVWFHNDGILKGQVIILLDGGAKHAIIDVSDPSFQ